MNNEEGERSVEVSEDVLNQLHWAHYYQRGKEKNYLCCKYQKS